MDKHQITERFLMILNEAIKEGQTKNKSTFAKSVGEHQQNLSLMEKGARAPTLEQIAIACKTYGYAPNWLILGIGAKRLKPNDQKTTEERLSNLEWEVSRLKRVTARVTQKTF